MSVPGAAPPLERLPGGGESLGPFTLAARVGAGRRTTAYLGFRDDPTVPLVIRTLNPNGDTEAFEAELRAARTLVAGQRLEPVLHIGHRTLVHATAIVGESLATILDAQTREKKPLSLHLALTIAIGIAERLLTLERRPHGDLVPHHVIVGYDGSIHLIDPAGDAYRERASAPDRTGYRSPEHVRGDGLVAASDVFTLGILMFEMSTGHRLFPGPTAREDSPRILEGEMPRPRDLVGDGYPIELQLVLRKLLRPSTAGRFIDAKAALDALRLVATTRTEVGPAQLAGWMKTRFEERHAQWRALAGAAAGTPAEMTPPLPPPRTSSRAPTRVSSRADLPAAPARAESQDEGWASQLTSEATQPTRAAGRRARLTDLDTFDDFTGVPMPEEPTRTGPPPTPPERRLITLEDLDRADAEEAHDTLQPVGPTRPDATSPPDSTEPMPRTRPRPAGLAASPPPADVPDLPTEVTRRFEALRKKAAEARIAPDEPADSDAVTSLDEIEEAPGPRVEFLPSTAVPGLGLIDSHTDPGGRLVLTPSPLDALDGMITRPDRPFERPSDSGFTPTPLLDLEFDLAAPPPGAPPPAWIGSGGDEPLDPESTPSDLSADLVLSESAASDRSASPQDLASDLLVSSRRQPSDESFDDTIEESSALDVLSPDELALVQRAMALPPPEPNISFESPPLVREPLDRQATLRTQDPRAKARSQKPASSGPAARPLGAAPRSPMGSPTGGRSSEADIATHVIRERDVRGRPPDPPTSSNQAHIATQVVRDRIEGMDGPQQSAGIREAPSLDAPSNTDADGATPLQRGRIQPGGVPRVPPGSEPIYGGEESSANELVIPISDAELARTDLRRRVYLALAVLLPVLALAAWAVWSRLTVAEAVPIESHPVPVQKPPPEQTAPAPSGLEGVGADKPSPYEEEETPLAEQIAPAEELEPPEGDADDDEAAEPPPPSPARAPPPVAPEPRLAPTPAATKVAPPPAATKVAPAPPPRADPPPAAPEPPAASAAFSIRVRVLPKDARIEVDGRRIANEETIVVRNRPLKVVASLPGYETMTEIVSPTRREDVLLLLVRENPPAPEPR